MNGATKKRLEATAKDLFAKRFAAELLIAAAESEELSATVNWKKEAVAEAKLVLRLMDMLGIPQGEFTGKAKDRP